VAAGALQMTAADTKGAAIDLTSPGSTIGTVAYMSPEQARGETLDARSDVFSFGAVLYEMVTGRVAFDGSTSAVIFNSILTGSPRPIDPALKAPAELERIIGKALEKDPDLRYQTARDLQIDLKRLRRDTTSGKIEVAAPILAHSTCLTPADLATIAKECGAAHADIITARPPAAPPAARPVGPREESSANAEASELSELFYSSGAPERRLILINLDYAMIAPADPASVMQRTDIWRLESAALQHNSEAVVRELERMLGLSRAQARRIVNDELGEPIAVAAKALNLPSDVLQRMLLFMNPHVGQSVDRVYELAELYGEITVKDGRVEQTNFNTYKILRIYEAPAIEVYIVQSQNPPGGIGETGTSAVVPAVTNAIFAAVGKRLRKLPIDAQ
jgi:hypothetical protein